MEDEVVNRRWKRKSRIRRVMTIAKFKMWLKKRMEEEVERQIRKVIREKYNNNLMDWFFNPIIDDEPKNTF